MIYYPSQTIPAGYLICDGSEVLIADYPLLFNAIGYIGGNDVLTGYFRLPDMRGTVPAGYNPDLVGSSNPLAGDFGDQVGAPTHQLTVNEMPSHTHNSVNYVAGYTGGSQSGFQTLLAGTSSSSVVAAVKSTGGGQGHSSVQPTKLYNWLIKAKNVVTLGGYTEDFEVVGNLGVNGTITLPLNKYIENGGAINLNNSDIINTNSIWMNDESTGNEGINFLKQNGDKTNPEDYENLRGYRGKVYYDNKVLISEDDFYYKSNDTLNFGSGNIYPGHVTSSTTRVDFCMVLPKSLKNINTIQFTDGSITIRGGSGYLDNSYSSAIPLTGSSVYVPTIEKKQDNLIRVEIQKSSAYSNVTNNTPVTVHFNSVKMKFT